MNTYEYILFDLDGTLTDPGDRHNQLSHVCPEKVQY